MQGEDDELPLDPAVSNGLERSIHGTRVGVTTVLHLMARMKSADAVVEYLSTFSMGDAPRKVGVPDVGVCIRYAARLVRRKSLSRAGVARFRRALALNEEAYRAVVTWTTLVLDVAGDTPDLDFVVQTSPEIDRELATAALDYAAALCADEWASEMDRNFVSNLSLGIDMSEVDLARIVDFCTYHTSIGLGLRVPTPAAWADLWSALVEHAEAGYRDDIHELTNALDARDLLEDLVSLIRPDPQIKWRTILDSLDRRYDLATTDIPVSLLGPDSPWAPQPWWWWRAPTMHGPALAEDLARLGITASS